MEKELLNEKSISRLWKHMQEHDTGTITAFKYRIWDRVTKQYGPVLTRKENMQRNFKLKAQLQTLRYGLTSILGAYIENYGSPNAVRVDENVFFVVDLNDTGNLLNDLKKLGDDQDQDSILFIPKGGETATLYGISENPDSFPGYGVSKKYNERMFGADGTFFSEVSGRPFKYYDTELTEHLLPEGYMGRWGCYGIAHSDWRTIELPRSYYDGD